MKILNFRKCIITNELKSKVELIRVVKTKDGKFLVNSNAKGRGAYISKTLANPHLIIKKRVLNRSFRTVIPMAVYEELMMLIKGDEDGSKKKS